MFSLKQRRFRGKLVTLHNYLREIYNHLGVSLFSEVTSDGTIGNGHRLCSSWKELSSLNRLWYGWLTIPWGISKIHRCGSEEHGLVADWTTLGQTQS